MTKRVYRTAQGKIVDLGALQLQNENVRAVGNMSVNARGDLLDGWNRPIESRTKQVARQYDKQTSNVSDGEVTTTSQTKTNQVKKSRETPIEVPTPPEDFQDHFDKSITETAPDPSTTSGGLAAAIAKARRVQQESMAKPGDSGIKRI